MKKVGDVLREERLRQGKSLSDVSKATKVRLEYLEYIEDGRYSLLPDPIYIRGFILSYAEFLGVPSDQVLPFYRREKVQPVDAKVSNLPRPVRFPQLIKITPGKLAITFVSIVLTVFLAVLFVQYRSFAGVPVLIVEFPPEDYVTTQSNIEVIGKTENDATTTINGESVVVSVDGSFRVNYQLKEGINRIKIITENKLGKQRVVERVVERKLEDSEK